MGKPDNPNTRAATAPNDMRQSNRESSPITKVTQPGGSPPAASLVRRIYGQQEEQNMRNTMESNVTGNATSSIPLAGIAAVAGITALLLRRADNRACMTNVLTNTAQDVTGVIAGLGSSALHGTQKAAEGAQHAAMSVGSTALLGTRKVTGSAQQAASTAASSLTSAVKPLSATVAAGVGSMLSRGGTAVKAVSVKEERMMQNAKDMTRETSRALRDLPRTAEVKMMVKQEVSRQLEQHLSHHHHDLEQQLQQNFLKHEAVLSNLADNLNHLTVDVRARRGGFPWTLLMLGGAAYYLYSNAQARQKVMGYLEQLSPNAQENLQRAGQSLRQGVESVRRGEDPRPALRDTWSETQQALQKTVSNVQEKVQSSAGNAQGGQDNQDNQEQSGGNTQDTKGQGAQTGTTATAGMQGGAGSAGMTTADQDMASRVGGQAQTDANRNQNQTQSKGGNKNNRR